MVSRTTVRLGVRLPLDGSFRVVNARIGGEVVRVRIRVDPFTRVAFVKSLYPPPEAQPVSVGALKR